MKREKKGLQTAIGFLILFIVWTVLILTIDVQNAGESGTKLGFATFNVWLHERIGVNMEFYTVTDYLGIVPFFVCLYFAFMGIVQGMKRRDIKKVDLDIILLGIYYGIVIFTYFVFEFFPVNYKPILIDGNIESSYPSSTTLLVLSVMPTLIFQANRRINNARRTFILTFISVSFTLFMIVGRLISGVHWITDIIGSVLFSTGLFLLYYFTVMIYCKRK